MAQDSNCFSRSILKYLSINNPEELVDFKALPEFFTKNNLNIHLKLKMTREKKEIQSARLCVQEEQGFTWNIIVKKSEEFRYFRTIKLQKYCSQKGKFYFLSARDQSIKANMLSWAYSK